MLKEQKCGNAKNINKKKTKKEKIIGCLLFLIISIVLNNFQGKTNTKANIAK
jgi:hypothetical protein